MKTRSKKWISIMMALFLCITTFLGINTKSVSAATGEQVSVYIFEYPRYGDINYNGQWGYPSKKLMNGWEMGYTDTLYLRLLGSIYGKIAYCIEPGVDQFTGDTLTQRDSTYLEQGADHFNKTINGKQVLTHLGRIMQYGYVDSVDRGWMTQDPEARENLGKIIATQILVWETVVGERDDDFNHVSTNGKDAVKSIANGHVLEKEILKHYKEIELKVQNHAKYPSFMDRNKKEADTIEMKWDGNQYIAKLTDTNGVLSEFKFSSKDKNLNFSIKGNELTITSKVAPEDVVSISAVKDTNKTRAVVIWGDGVYKPKPENYRNKQDVVTYGQEIKDPVSSYLNVKVPYGSLDLNKGSEDGTIKNVEFNIKGNGIDQNYKTDEKGNIHLENVAPGKYVITEITEDHYIPQDSKEITIQGGKEANVSFQNTLKKGQVKVTKTAEDGIIEGIEFKLTGTSLSGDTFSKTATTNKDGVAVFEDVLINGDTKYVIEEVNTNERYVVPENQDINVEWNKDTEVNFHNTLKKWNLTVTKQDSESTNSQGNTTLQGAVYGIYKGDVLLDQYTTNENGSFTTKNYVCGDDYTMKEISPSEGYLLDETVYKVGINAGEATVELNPISKTVKEEVVKGNIAITKTMDTDKTQIQAPEPNAEFEIYLKSAGSYQNAKDSERDYLVTDEQGYAATKDLPYGTYTVTQTKASEEGLDLLPSFDVQIDKDRFTYRYLINNARFRSHIKVTKTDAETGKVIPAANTGFKIYSPKGELVTMDVTYPTNETLDTFYTDETGTLITPLDLPHGRGYSLVEVKAPNGYILDSTPISFDITEENSEDLNGITVINITKSNTAQKGIINVSKQGEIFDSVNVSGDESMKIYTPVFKDSYLKGAEFEIRASEDIKTLDGTIRYAKDELVDTITTSEDGIATSKELYLGKYYIKEIKAPEGYVINDEIHNVELTYAGQEIKVTSTSDEFYNQRKKVEVNLLKELELDNKFAIGNNGEIGSVMFGLYANQELVAQDGTIIPKDGLIEMISLINENGKFNSDLPVGKYYVKELATDRHYILDENKYEFEFKYDENNLETKSLTINNGEAIKNELIYGSIKGLKVTDLDVALEGAKIGLFYKDTTEFTSENAIMIQASDKDGKFEFNNIPYGDYIIREIKSPTGYVLDTNAHRVSIKEDSQIIEIKLINELIHGSVELTKVDADYPDNKLNGAVFEVYADTNNNKKLDSKDALIGTLEEYELGSYHLDNLPYGQYFVKEVKAPEGFRLDENVYGFFIEFNNQISIVENKAGIGFINQPETGELKIIKTSSDNVVEGFTFEITGPNGYSEIKTTDKNGEIVLTELRLGEYKISEILDDKSSAYERPEDKTVNIKLDKIVEVKMHNVFKETPQTGDDRNLALWYGIGGVSIIAIVGASIFYIKKKKED